LREKLKEAHAASGVGCGGSWAGSESPTASKSDGVSSCEDMLDVPELEIFVGFRGHFFFFCAFVSVFMS
jgi:hypothetical protein